MQQEVPMLATPDAVTSFIPRTTPRPLARIGASLTVAVTVLALLVSSAVPARANDDLAKAVVAAIAIGAIVHSIDKGRAKADPVPEQMRSPRVPAVCALEVAGPRRDITVYAERCLRREGFDFRLPRHCAREARIFGRPDRIYTESCLREAGFRVGGGRDHRRDRDWDRPRRDWY
jgi:hypothetical protein